MSSELFRVLGTTPCACGRCRRVDTERVHLTDALPEALRGELTGRGALFFGDGRTLAACGTALADTLANDGVPLRAIDLGNQATELHADWSHVERVGRLLEETPRDTLPVAVGSGTINDLVKAAAHQAGRPYVVVATAPSMNGYTSAIAAITRDGLKLTLPSTPPVAVLASPAVLAGSPRRLALSGLADLLSKPVSEADWRLAHVLWDEAYCPRPGEIAGRAVERAVAARRRGADAAVVLFEALLLSGVSMAVAGSSSPASGGEHLISHFLDMTAESAPGGARVRALHGEQVGVATRVTARLYGRLLARDVHEIDWDRAAAVAPAAEDVAARLASGSPVPAPLRARFVEQGVRKLERLGSPQHRVSRMRERWETVRSALRADLRPAAGYLDVLQGVGAPSTADALGVSAAELRTAVLLARWVRDRYTVLDLADDLGLLEQEADEALRGIA